jgi:hypothetical protein
MLDHVGDDGEVDERKEPGKSAALNSEGVALGTGRGAEMAMHRLILCAVTEHWSQYVAYLESVYKDIVCGQFSLSFPFGIDISSFICI